MSAKSPIEWTDATWQPITGCSVVSPGCTHCYAMKLAGTRLQHHPSRAGLTTMSKAGPVWNGQVRFNEEWLTQPLHWKRPRRIFVCAHGDLFHEDCPDAWIDRVFAVMALAPQHAFQVLTKRSKRMREYLTSSLIAPNASATQARICQAIDDLFPQRTDASRAAKDRVLSVDVRQAWPLPNVWLGVSTERQQEADERIPDLLATPAAIRFISAEPLLGPLDLLHVAPTETGYFNTLSSSTGPNLDWVIAGGESDKGARPMHPDWARGLRDQCDAAGVEFFFKQWGEYLPVGQHLPGAGKVHGATAVKPGMMKLHYGGSPKQAPKYAFAERGVAFAATADNRLTFRVGKSRAGRLLDGVEHNAMPRSAP